MCNGPSGVHLPNGAHSQPPNFHSGHSYVRYNVELIPIFKLWSASNPTYYTEDPRGQYLRSSVPPLPSPRLLSLTGLCSWSSDKDSPSLFKPMDMPVPLSISNLVPELVRDILCTSSPCSKPKEKFHNFSSNGRKLGQLNGDKGSRSVMMPWKKSNEITKQLYKVRRLESCFLRGISGFNSQIRSVAVCTGIIRQNNRIRLFYHRNTFHHEYLDTFASFFFSLYFCPWL